MYRLALLFLIATTLVTAATFKLTAPTGPLNETEKKLVGKWSGSRANIKWEIVRSDDRSFELALEETDIEDSQIVYSNYAIGHWWTSDGNYYFEWKNWWGDEGDFAGVIKEPIQSTGSDQIVTLSVGEEDPENVEVRVADFSLAGWEYKPSHLQGHHH